MKEPPAPPDLSGAEMPVLFDWLSRISEAGVPINTRGGTYDAHLQQARDDVLGRG